ncbi:MAG: hypothetical protein CEN92_128 [Candidatus Berkelbacteria bacterium Licking1014_96]|uniref:DUF5667 domain-containing protein n=1 Tax=Candidatus Berkelbacteria bacterium Licking1014_96 TaxID=2017149 RepID=A0A554LGW1_9BACT|nr:MAG: hypothetical protein CEN92_128 [Candidatus Berkelbacteria bacterium Licking1014_96]
MTKSFRLWVCLILAVCILLVPFVVIQANDTSQLELGEPGILPNSFWYNFEIVKERLVIIFTFSSLSKAKKLLSLSTERLSELKKMVELQDIPNSQKTINRYTSSLDEMKSNLDECHKNNGKTKEQIEKSRQEAAWQSEQLLQIKQNAPRELEQDINSAISKSADIINMKCE